VQNLVHETHLPLATLARPDTQSDAETATRSKVFYVGFKGDAKQVNMDMSRLGQVPAQNAADKPVDGVAEKKGSGYTTIR